MAEPTRRARLSAPPVFSMAGQQPGIVTLASDTGAIAHVFVAEADVMRVLLLTEGRLRLPPSWAIAPGATDIAEPGRDRMATAGFSLPPFDLAETDTAITITTSRLRLSIRRQGFICRWEQREGDGWRRISQDRPTQAHNFGWWDDAVYHYVRRQPGERYHGLGERGGPMDRAGQRWRMTSLDPMGYDAEITDPLYKTIPFLLVVDAENAAHGVFYDNTHDMVFDLGREHDNYHPHYRYIRAESGDLDYWLIAGPDAGAVTRRFTWLTGRPALMPRWAVDYSGSTMTYTDAPDAQTRMNDFIAGLQQHDIGCSSFHLSSGYTSIGDKRYVFHWNRDKFPDPAGFVAHFAAHGIDLVPNIKPALLLSHPLYADVAAKGWFISDADGQPIECQFWDEVGSYIDFTNPDAADWWRAKVKAQLLANGIRATWNDNNEYEVWDERALIHGFGSPRPAAAERPIQAMLMMRASRAAQIAWRPTERPYLVTRSGMAGLQRYAQTWTGDNRTAWNTLRYNQKMALGLALSGVSNSGHDVGGFDGPAPGPELLLRWVQAGVLMPRFSIHSWNTDRTVNEPWMYPEVTNAITAIMAHRRALVPLLHDLLWRHHADYQPVTRPIWLDFPHDAQAWVDGDSYLLGPDLLVAPALDPGVTSVRAWLPAGAAWHDLRDGQLLAGGQWADLAAPMAGLPPLLARDGSAQLIDITRGGFAAEPRRPAVLLFPGQGSFEWQGFDETGTAWPDMANPPLWALSVVANDSTIAITARWQGRVPPPADRLGIVLPLAERRAVVVNGVAVASTVETVLGAERQLFEWVVG
jgi:alpha-glucosidase